MKYVIKRDGTRQVFIKDKIINAIKSASNSVNANITREEIKAIYNRVCDSVFAHDTHSNMEEDISVETIQDTIEVVLMQFGYFNIAKSFILYRKAHTANREAVKTLNSYAELVDSYVQSSDWRVKENSTVDYSIGGLILHNSGAVTANYWLNEVYDEEIANAHRNADMHIHDLSMLTGYCAGWSLKQLLLTGVVGPSGRVASGPAKHLSVLCNQMVNFLGIMQNEWAGAQAFSSFDTYLAPFVRAENLTFKEVKQAMQAFIYGVNVPSRWGTQAPFSNVTFDWTVPEDLADEKCIVGGKLLDFKYKDCQKEMDVINKAFLTIMLEGDYNGRGFQYPIPTYSITKDFDWSDTENNRLLFEMTAKYGTPYFSNYVNSDMNPSDVRAMCCRLRLDLRELRKAGGGYFGSGESTGSVGVVTLNLPRLAYNSNNELEYFLSLRQLLNKACRSLHMKRRAIEKYMNMGLYPYTKVYLGSFRNHFSTIGVLGMNEACMNASWLMEDIRSTDGKDLAKRTLDFIKGELQYYQELYGDLFNLEATPAESTSYRLAMHDAKKFPDIYHAGTKQSPYYTNSTQLNVDNDMDLFDALEHQDDLQCMYTSGTVFHTFLGEKLPDWKAAMKMVRIIANNYKLPYYTISPIYSICPSHGYLAGEVTKCPECDAVTEVYSRITGYYRPVSNWNAGKAQEQKERTLFDNSVHTELEILDAVLQLSEDEVDSRIDSILCKEQPENESEKEYFLFTSDYCASCKMAKELISAIPFTEVNVSAEEGIELALKYEVRQAPTLIEIAGDKFKTISGLTAISNFITKQR